MGCWVPRLGSSEFGLLSAVKKLIERGADVNAQAGDYVTPLAAAVNGGHNEIVRLLLDHCGDPNIQGKNGHVYGKMSDVPTTLQLAVRQGNHEIAALLLRHGAGENVRGTAESALTVAVNQDDETMIHVLLDYGAEPGPRYARLPRSERDLTLPLEAVCKRGNVAIVRLLLERGADPNASTSYGGSPLENAIQRKSKEVLDLQLEFGANPFQFSPGPGGSGVGATAAKGDEEMLRRFCPWSECASLHLQT
jgi:ankyrin repeat protein